MKNQIRLQGNLEPESPAIHLAMAFVFSIGAGALITTQLAPASSAIVGGLFVTALMQLIFAIRLSTSSYLFDGSMELAITATEQLMNASNEDEATGQIIETEKISVELNKPWYVSWDIAVDARTREGAWVRIIYTVRPRLPLALTGPARIIKSDVVPADAKS